MGPLSESPFQMDLNSAPKEVIRSPHVLNRGSRASRRPSPSRLNETTVRTMASPGKVEIHQAVIMASRPSLTIEPHDGVGGWTPNPRNDSAASSRIVLPMLRV